MMRDHTRIEELIAIRSIGGLDPQEQAELEREMASHGPDCEECRRLETEYGEVAGRLAFALDPVALRPGFAEETIGLALGEAPASRPGRARGPRGVRSWPWRRRWCCSSAARCSGRPCSAAVARCPRRPRCSPSSRRIRASPGPSPRRSRRASRGSTCRARGWSRSRSDQVYELWVIEGDTPAAAVCVRPGDDGSVFAFADKEVTGSEVLAVTVEPSTCSDAPTTPPSWAAQVTTA